MGPLAWNSTTEQNSKVFLHQWHRWRSGTSPHLGFHKWQDTALRMVSGSGPAFDIVIFGASGYTGQYVIEYVVRNVEDDFKKQQGSVQEPRKLKWAVAGRSKDKLAKVLMSASLNVPGFDHSTIELIVCDVKDESSLKKMVTQTKVLLNCVGPYRFSGEPVVKACAQYGTHYVDISGEPQFLETTQLKYNDQAAQNGTYIVGSCGFDSIPSDMGQVVVHRSMDGPVNTIETYLKVDTPSDEPGATINFATYQSAIYGYAMADELKQGPSRRMAENTNFEMKLYGRGWQGQDEGSLTDLGPETTEVCVTVKGCNVGYGSTCECLVQSALVILQESDKMPGQGGVFPPGYAFKNTTLVERLHERGVTFDVQVKHLEK